jgi:hypothetical protein
MRTVVLFDLVMDVMMNDCNNFSILKAIFKFCGSQASSKVLSQGGGSARPNTARLLGIHGLGHVEKRERDREFS